MGVGGGGGDGVRREGTPRRLWNNVYIFNWTVISFRKHSNTHWNNKDTSFSNKKGDESRHQLETWAGSSRHLRHPFRDGRHVSSWKYKTLHFLYIWWKPCHKGRSICYPHPPSRCVDVWEDYYKTQLLIKKTMWLDYIVSTMHSYEMMWYMYPSVPLQMAGNWRNL